MVPEILHYMGGGGGAGRRTRRRRLEEKEEDKEESGGGQLCSRTPGTCSLQNKLLSTFLRSRPRYFIYTLDFIDCVANVKR